MGMARRSRRRPASCFAASCTGAAMTSAAENNFYHGGTKLAIYDLNVTAT